MWRTASGERGGAGLSFVLFVWPTCRNTGCPGLLRGAWTSQQHPRPPARLLACRFCRQTAMPFQEAMVRQHYRSVRAAMAQMAGGGSGGVPAAS